MERNDALNGRGDADDARLRALLRGLDAPSPSADFTRRTMRAVKRASLAAGRRPLRDPFASLVGWAAIIGGVALSAIAVAVSQPAAASIFTRAVGLGVTTGVWLMQFRGVATVIADVLITTGTAVSRAATTAEGAAGLVAVAMVGALSFSALHRLLISEREGDQWQGQF
jgi:hypothetical protein